MQKKPKPKFKIREGSKKKTQVDSDVLSLDEMLVKFMTVKKAEGLAPRIIDEYYKHYDNLKEFLGEDMMNENVTTEDFQGYIGFMLHDKELALMTVNIRVRTMRAFIRYCYRKGFIDRQSMRTLRQSKHPRIR
ncbi:phage integrase SAM-like domain-containing protein [Peribacillus frigoritolerans]|uniref:phage integrase SAM-like domain-containing protein n=1 Tax=Peribacillus frigoritolerans TaxID=450367 RepID=UPI003D294FF8